MSMELQQYGQVGKVELSGQKLKYAIANKYSKWRLETLLTKEPVTISWLNRLRGGDILLDIGANVGMYSVYAASLRKAIVIAIEPESQNFGMLCKNIWLNLQQERITPYPIALSDKCELNKLYLSDFIWDGGSSCHSLANEVGFDLKARKSPFQQGIASYSLDMAVESGWFNTPRAIKIDVDGFEHLVVAGALQTLKNPEVKTLCIEVNFKLSEHIRMIESLKDLDYAYSQEQVDQSIRREGSFEGCSEVIFDRIESRSIHISNPFKNIKCHQGSAAEDAFDSARNKIESADVEKYPFPALYLSNLFPAQFYAEIQNHFPSNEQMQPLGETGRVSEGAYPNRYVTLFNKEHLERLSPEKKLFWEKFAKAMMCKEFAYTCVNKFMPWCSNQLALLRDSHGKVRLRSDALLVSDRTDYAIGPHTDLPHRLISFLFYWPKDESIKYLGTSFYKHKDPNFICPGGPHYSFEDFTRLGSAPYLPNSLLMFVRTGRSFHGVEPIKEKNIERRLLINNIRMVDVQC